MFALNDSASVDRNSIGRYQSLALWNPSHPSTEFWHDVVKYVRVSSVETVTSLCISAHGQSWSERYGTFTPLHRGLRMIWCNSPQSPTWTLARSFPRSIHRERPSRSSITSANLWRSGSFICSFYIFIFWPLVNITILHYCSWTACMSSDLSFRCSLRWCSVKDPHVHLCHVTSYNHHKGFCFSSSIMIVWVWALLLDPESPTLNRIFGIFLNILVWSLAHTSPFIKRRIADMWSSMSRLG